MAEIFLEIEAINQLILEAQQFPSGIKKKKFTSKHTGVKLQKIKQSKY